MAKLTNRTLQLLAPDPDGRDTFAWDGELRGFGVRMKPSGAATFLVQYRTPEGRTRRLALGRVGTLTPEEARKAARQSLAAVARGTDPSVERKSLRHALTVAEMCDFYMDAARAGQVTTQFHRAKSASTVGFDQGRIERHIKPLIGKQIANRLSRHDVQRMVDAISLGRTAGIFAGKPRGRAVVTGGAGTAARVVGLLGGIWTWAERRGLVSGPNPAHGIEKAASATLDRVLSFDEVARLGSVIRAAENDQPAAVAAVRLLALSGLRREEACGLRWREIHEADSCLRLENTKTGRSRRAIGKAVVELLRSLPRNGSEFVFPAKRSAGFSDLKKRIATLFDMAGLGDSRCRELRRTFSTIASNEGYSDATIGELLGHAQSGVTARHYIRRPDAALVAAAEHISGIIARALGGDVVGATVTPLRRISQL